MQPALTDIADGLAFPEGPVILPDGTIAVVEIAAGVTRIDGKGRKSTLARPGAGPMARRSDPMARFTSATMAAFAWTRRDGLLFVAGQPDDYSGGRIERVDIETGKVEVLYTHCDGHALRGPNDLVFDAHGGFYFTDHGKRRPRDVDFGGLYYAKADGSLIRELVHPMIMPNGVGLSPDGSEVYVAETRTGHLWAFAIEAPGVIRKGPPHENSGRHLAGPPGFTSFELARCRSGRQYLRRLAGAGRHQCRGTGRRLRGLHRHARSDLHQHLLRRCGPADGLHHTLEHWPPGEHALAAPRV